MTTPFSSSKKMLTPVAVVVLVALSGTLFSASGQETAPAAPAKPAQKPAAAPLPPDPLRGPKVEDAGVPGESRRFGGPSKDRKDRTEPPIPHRAFVRALENMQNANPDGSLKFNPEQRQYVKKIEDELKTDVQKFVNEHREEIASLPPEVLNRIRQATGVTVQLPAGSRAKAKPDSKPEPKKDPVDPASPMEGSAPTSNDKPDKSPSEMKDSSRDGMMDQDSMQDSMTSAPKQNSEATLPPRELARVLMEKAPKPADYHAKVWQVLSEPQREALKQELTKYREQAAGRNGNAKPNSPSNPIQTNPNQAKPTEAKQSEDGKKKSDSQKGKQSEDSSDKPKTKRNENKNAKQQTLDSFRGKDGKIDISKLPPRLQERLKNLSDEDREKALKELEKQRKKN